VRNRKAVEDILSAVLDASYRDGKMEIKTELETSGFYLVDG
jgi:hypothetical protein